MQVHPPRDIRVSHDRKVDIGEPPAPVSEPAEQGKPHQFGPTAAMALIVVFKLDAIASIGTAVALPIFILVTAAHFRVRAEPGARTAKLALAIAAVGAVYVARHLGDQRPP